MNRIRLILTAMLFATTTTAVAEKHILSADGKTDTYKLISKAGFYAETNGGNTPDAFMYHPSYEHISQIKDDIIGGHVFAFDIHVDFKDGNKIVTDGNKGELDDRQRNEIKCMAAKPGTVAKNGETITYRWKFMLPHGMKTTSKFCHVHQIKGMGDSQAVAHPVFTLTCRTSGNKQELEVIHVPYEGAKNRYLGILDLAPLLGRWIQASETLTVGRHGCYELTLTDIESGVTLLSIKESDIEIWRETDDESTMRAKWGIYRSLGENLSLKSQLRSERVLFADFETHKGAVSAITETTAEETFTSDTPLYDLQGRVVANPVPGLYLRDGRKILITNN